jgi:hypothetical protein
MVSPIPVSVAVVEREGHQGELPLTFSSTAVHRHHDTVARLRWRASAINGQYCGQWAR